jgi:Caspase domain
MRRAGIFIGVDRTGQLQPLNDAAAGARRMYEWALQQGMEDGTNARLITDQGQKVTPDTVYDAIKAIIDGPGVDQLILYFAGHGVNINRSEHWLLSDAPVKTSAAVNVAGSVDLARYCGIPYVVFVSDACRVAPEGIQAQNVRGVDVFPNDAASDRARPVDQFFACRLGRTAAEIRDPAEAANSFTALYTSALLDAVSGLEPSVLEAGDAAGDAARYVKPARLRDHLELEVPRRIVEKRMAARVNQSPDAIVLAHSNWLARLEQVPGARPRTGGPGTERPRGFGVAPPVAPSAAMSDLLHVAATDTAAALAVAFNAPRAQVVPGVAEIAATAARVAAPFGPDHHETQCGIKVLGARIVDFLILEGRAQYANNEGNDLRVDPAPFPVSVLLTFDGGAGTVVPAVQGFLTALTFDDGELVDVAWEPSANHPRWYEYQARANDVRTLRGFAAAASRLGRFRLEGGDALAVAQRMQFAKGIDPALALYAAYAYHDLQELDRLKHMSAYLRIDLGARLFDVAMLARELRDVKVDRHADVVPFVPMLAQGWDLVTSGRVRLHDALKEIRPRVRESLWSLFDVAGVDMLRSAMRSGEVR